MAGIHPFLPILIAGLVVTLGVAGLAWRSRSTPGARWFAGFMIAAAIWLGAESLAGLASVPEPTLLLTKVVYLGVCLMVPGWLLFALEYTHYTDLVTPRLLGLLAIEPAVFLTLTWLNPRPLVWESVDVSGVGMAGIDVVHGQAFWLHTAYSYVVLLVGLVLLLRMVLRSQRLYRSQVIALTVALLVPIVANVLYLLGPIEVDITPLTFVVSGSILGMAIFRYRLGDVTPVAREAVIENVTDGVLVVDDEGRIVDVNPTARARLGLEHAAVVGERVTDCLPAGFDVSAAAGVPPGEHEVVVDGEPRVYDVTVSDLGDDDRSFGQVVVFRDLTERIEHERELERQNEQLEQFASFVSHDLRNPLNVASGFVDLLGREYDDDRIDRVDDSLERMETLLEEMLTLARQGQTIESTAPVELAAPARAAWEVVDTGDADLVVGASTRIRADRSRLQQVFENLFRNAIDHGPSGVTVRVELIETGPDSPADVDGFAVVDDGPGIPPDKRETIFEVGETTSRDGTGLGLAIVENIAEAHGWTIESVERGGAEGARFEVRGVTPAPAPGEGESPEEASSVSSSTA